MTSKDTFIATIILLEKSINVVDDRYSVLESGQEGKKKAFFDEMEESVRQDLYSVCRDFMKAHEGYNVMLEAYNREKVEA